MMDKKFKRDLRELLIRDCKENFVESETCKESACEKCYWLNHLIKSLVNACKGCCVFDGKCSEGDKAICDRWDLVKAQLAVDRARMRPLLETVYSQLQGVRQHMEKVPYERAIDKTIRELAQILGYES